MNKTFKKACLAAAVGMVSFSQAALAEVTISGWLNESMTYYDDGTSSDIVQSSDNGTTLGSRLAFGANTDLPAGLNAGVELIFEPESTSTPLIFSNQDGGGLTTSFLNDATIGGGGGGSFDSNNRDNIRVLSNNIYVGGAWGKLTIGKLSPATDNIAVLEDPSLTLWSTISPVFRGNGFSIRGMSAGASALGLLGAAGLGTGATMWGDFLNCYGTGSALVGGAGIGLDCGNGDYRRGVRYDLPTFIENLSIATGTYNDDAWDVSVKYKHDLGRLHWSIAAGYTYDNDGGVAVHLGAGDGSDSYQVQTGLMDPVTGLFGTFAYQHEETDLPTGLAAATNAILGGSLNDDTDAWWLKVGIKRAWNSLGDTAISFNYGQYNDQYSIVQAAAGVTDSEVERIGFSIDQYIGSNLIIYGNYQNLSLDVDQSAASLAAFSFQGADDLDTFTLGLTYFF